MTNKMEWSVWVGSGRQRRIATMLHANDAVSVALRYGNGTRVCYMTWVALVVDAEARTRGVEALTEEVEQVAARKLYRAQEKNLARVGKGDTVRQVPFACRPAQCHLMQEECGEGCKHHQRLKEFKEWIERANAQQQPWPNQHEWVAQEGKRG